MTKARRPSRESLLEGFRRLFKQHGEILDLGDTYAPPDPEAIAAASAAAASRAPIDPHGPESRAALQRVQEVATRRGLPAEWVRIVHGEMLGIRCDNVVRARGAKAWRRGSRDGEPLALCGATINMADLAGILGWTVQTTSKWLERGKRPVECVRVWRTGFAGGSSVIGKPRPRRKPP